MPLELPVAAEWPEPEETSAELQLGKTVAELEMVPSGALVASSTVKEMLSCTLLLRCHRRTLRLARFAVSVSMPQLRGASKRT